MTLAESRLINGLLKGGVSNETPEELQVRLSHDVEIVVPPERATADDLWPAAWALAAILERQFYGRVYLRCGLSAPLLSPIPFGPQVEFAHAATGAPLSIVLGNAKGESLCSTRIVGDARRNALAIGITFSDPTPLPTPLECFALAGYLGFAAVAHFTNIPPYRADYARPVLDIPYDPPLLARRLRDLGELTSLGIGQLGQAYLALLFFWYRGAFDRRRVALVDDDLFEKENGRTQLLLDPRLGDGGPETWLDRHKVPHIASVIEKWNVDVIARRERIKWGWARNALPALALVGLHDFESRRMACAAGFERLIEAGVGTNLLQPRVSWHALPGDAQLGKQVFPDAPETKPKFDSDAEWAQKLKETPGRCGWVSYLGISATAPCLGATAVAFALSELGLSEGAAAGTALMWSPCLPLYRETISQRAPGIRAAVA